MINKRIANNTIHPSESDIFRERHTSKSFQKPSEHRRVLNSNTVFRFLSVCFRFCYWRKLARAIHAHTISRIIHYKDCRGFMLSFLLLEDPRMSSINPYHLIGIQRVADMVRPPISPVFGETKNTTSIGVMWLFLPTTSPISCEHPNYTSSFQGSKALLLLQPVLR